MKNILCTNSLESKFQEAHITFFILQASCASRNKRKQALIRCRNLQRDLGLLPQEKRPNDAWFSSLREEILRQILSKRGRKGSWRDGLQADEIHAIAKSAVDEIAILP
jgi:hypothetical protein